ncbi:MAG: glycoside hydrolase family 15 protein, partial [Acidobacteria bacterium]|nr:glycoside hydrolase family 15 protein [Acidobacteriota bacterium]
MKSPFAPIRSVENYLPLEDHGLIGDGDTAALVGRDGAISWLCVPRFDCPPLFCGILDAQRGGVFRIAPENLAESRQYYEGDSGVLVTEMRGDAGLVRLTDALLLHAGADLREDASAGRRELLRWVAALKGPVRLEGRFDPFGGARVEPRSGGLLVRCPQQPELELHLLSSIPLQGL